MISLRKKCATHSKTEVVKDVLVPTMKEVFGDAVEAKVILYFIGNPSMRISINGLSKCLDENRTTVTKYVNTFEKKGFITRDPKTKSLMLNNLNETVSKINEYNRVAIKHEISKKHREEWVDCVLEYTAEKFLLSGTA